jgi:predicted amidohydrolase YtcJ
MRDEAERIFRGGTILTMNDASPRVEAVAIADGRILAAGAESAVMAIRGDSTVIVELSGKTLMPSFIDAHGHFANAPQIWGDVHEENLGKKRAHFMSPMASAVAKGLHCSDHNDFSVTPIDPMRMVWSAVTRQSRSGEIIGPDERVDPWQALKALTIEAA